LLRNLCLGLEDLQLVFMISSHELFIKLLKDDERKLLVDQMRKRSPRINLSTKPVTSFYDIPGNEGNVIRSCVCCIIAKCLSCNSISRVRITIFSDANDNRTEAGSARTEQNSISNVFLYESIRNHQCTSSLLQDFVHAKQLFAACLELVTEFSPKLRQVMLNEMLLLDIYTHEAGAGVSGERPPSDLISRVRGYLEMRVPDIPLRQVIAEECVAFLLNWRENEYLTMQVPLPLVQTNPYVKLGQLLAATCKELPGPKESRRTAKDLWEVVVQICSVSSQHKRGNDGRVSLIKHRESTLGIMYR
ncbi:INT8 protein, partial [Oreotrochilus melanogaster]|nr:INT8 protein [Oreotrochilus melanogaster]